MANAIADYCIRYPEADIVHVWLADHMNNHCECENCYDKRPSDLYVDLLNRIDEVLIQRNINTKIVFLIYVDLLWEPQESKLNNPDRFILMFAPITRTYSKSLADAEIFDVTELKPYIKNHVSFPKSVSENLAWLFKWQEHFSGDSFIFDYHFMWDHFLDPGYYQMAKILFKDMKYLDKYHLNGMISCQNQRVFFPTSLGMVVMAEVLWNKETEFERIAEKYFCNAFGTDGKLVMDYMETLSELFQSSYLRGEHPLVNEEAAEKYTRVFDVVEEFKKEIQKHLLRKEELETVQRKSWKYLLPHGELCVYMAETYKYMAEGKFDRAYEAKDKTLEFVWKIEKELQDVFDVCLFVETFERTLNQLKDGGSLWS